MKRIGIALALGAALLLPLAACAREDAPAVTPTHTPAATASPHVSPEATPPVTATDTPVPGGTAEPGSVGDDLKDAAKDAGDAVKDAAEGVGDAVRGAADKAKTPPTTCSGTAGQPFIDGKKRYGGTHTAFLRPKFGEKFPPR